MTAPEFRNKKQRKQQVKLRKPGYAIANVSLKPVGGIPGDISAERLQQIT